jgi:hypothetical protein
MGEVVKMAIDLVSAIDRYLTPEVVRKIASTSGMGEEAAHTATRAAAPAILSALANMASKPGGSKKLADAVASQPSGVLSDLLGKMGSQQTATQGTSLWSSLLGGGVVGVLASTLAKYLGMSEGPMRTLVGLLTPVILGVLGNQQRAANLDNSGLARLLSDQAREISGAMPDGLHDALKASGLYGTDTHSPSRATTTSARPQASTASPRTASWAYWVLPLLLLGGLFWYLMPEAHRTEKTATTSPVQSTPGAERSSAYLMTVPQEWGSIGSRPNEYVNVDLYNRAGEKLGTIRDLLVDTNGNMAAALVDVGQFLGIGEKQIALRFDALRLEPQNAARRVVVDASREQIQSAPAVALPPVMRR